MRLKKRPMLCPFCKSTCTVENVCTNEVRKGKYVACSNEQCLYSSANAPTASEAIDAHNRICEAVNGTLAEELRNRISIAVSTFADIADYCKETRNLDSAFKTCALNLVRQRAERTIKAIKERKGTK